MTLKQPCEFTHSEAGHEKGKFMICTNPDCRSTNVKTNGKTYKNDVGVAQKYRCKSCGKFFSVKLEDAPERQEQTYSFKESGDNAEVSKVTNTRIKTLDDLIRVCEIDTNIWEITKWECSKWDSPARLRHYEGKHRVDDELTISELWRVKAFLKKNLPLIQLNDLKSEVLKEIASHSPIYPVIERKPKTGKKLLEIDLPDPHIGKLAWAEETGQDQDVKTIHNDFIWAVNELIEYAKIYDVEKILFPIGNDFFNSNSLANTTVNGTRQDEDTRWKKTFRIGRQIAIEAIDRLREVAPVDVVIVPGNHDFERVYTLGEVLSAWYRNCSDVDVENTPEIRKYYTYGKNLIGFTHGNEERIDNLPLIMASEKPSLWAESRFREWHLGHYHKKKEYKWVDLDEHCGVIVRHLRSLTATDAWHYQKGYIGSVRGGQAFVYDHVSGLVSQLLANIKAA